jgi:hypothetical protein
MSGEINLKFEAKRLDYIYNVLAQRPFAEVELTIFDIRQQVAQQQAPQFPGVVTPDDDPA